MSARIRSTDVCDAAKRVAIRLSARFGTCKKNFAYGHLWCVALEASASAMGA